MKPAEIKTRHAWKCRAKRSYGTEKQAIQAVREARANPMTVDGELLNPYKCTACGKWHIGRISAKWREEQGNVG